jgi:hypothetical protein
VGVPQVVMADRAQAYRQHRELTESSKLKELNLYTHLASSLQFYVCLHEKGPTKIMIFGLWVLFFVEYWQLIYAHQGAKN